MTGMPDRDQAGRDAGGSPEPNEPMPHKAGSDGRAGDARRGALDSGDLRARTVRLEQIFHDATELPREARRDFVRTAAGGAPDLEHEVMELLSTFDQGTRGVLATPVGALLVDTANDVPERIGHFRVLRAAGEGGMSRVFEAQQDSPRRRVALKLLRSGLIGKEAMARFSREVQALAAMNHPGIAHVYESGTFDIPGLGPQPYFAMEFIEGDAIDVFAARVNLSVRARLELVAAVADAVQHAHERGVVHRDLKPANIMIDSAGRPKVLDFGVARAADLGGDTLYTLTLRTEAGQLIGTVPYMAPEQVAGRTDKIDHRTDVYALGVILYELLVGVLPLDLRGKSLPDAIQRILHDEPTRLGSVDTRLRGDIETIVAKSLEKDPARRYPSAAALAEDLRRYLADQPVVAKPPSTLYQLNKFARRNRGLVTGIAVAAVALVLASIVSLFWAVSASSAAAHARHNERRAVAETYRSSVAAASSALRVGDATEARRQLAAAPEELRGWEWRHYQARLDDAVWVFDELPVVAAALTSDGAQINLFVSDNPSEARKSFRWRAFSATSFAPLDSSGIVHAQSVARGGDLLALALDHSARTLDLSAPQFALSEPRPTWAPSLLFPQTFAGSRGTLYTAWAPGRLALVRGPGKVDWLLNSGEESPAGNLADVDAGLLAFAAGSTVFSADVSDPGRLPVITPMPGHTSMVRALGWNIAPTAAHPRTLFSASDDGTLRAWDLTTAQPALFKVTDLEDARPRSLAVAPDGTRVAVGGESGFISIHDTRTGRRVARLVGPRAPVISLVFCPSGRLLLGLDATSTLRAFPVARDDPNALKGHGSYVYTATVDNSANVLFSGAWDGSVRAWDTRTLKPLWTTDLRPSDTLDTQVRALSLSPDGRWLAALISTRFPDRTDHTFQLAVIDRHNPDARPRIVTTLASSTIVHFVAPDAVAAFTEDGLALIGVHDGRTLAKAPVSMTDTASSGPDQVAFHAPSATLAFRTSNNAVAILDGRTLALRHTLPCNLTGLTALSFSPDGGLLACATADGDVSVLEVRTGWTLWTQRAHSGPVFALNWLPDGSRLISGGSDRTLRLWFPLSGTEAAQLRGHESYIMSLAVDDDGSIYSASGDTSVRVWSTEPIAQRWRRVQAAP